MTFVNGLLCSSCIGCGGSQSLADAFARSDLSAWLTVIASGLVDGFNPCAFSIVIVLSGVLAANGRHQRARLWAGVFFCAGSYLTYLFLGIGLLQALRALDGFSTVRVSFLFILSFVLLALSYLSFRDALRYHRARHPEVITLQLPAGVKRAIRAVAESYWAGPSVVVASFACGFVVTLLDSLCTGQVYVPVLALLAREPHAWLSFLMLAVYNLAFIVPLIAVFVLAAKGATALEMSVWSKRNVVPSKIALGIVFLILALLVMPQFGGFLAQNFSPPSAPV